MLKNLEISQIKSFGDFAKACDHFLDPLKKINTTDQTAKAAQKAIEDIQRELNTIDEEISNFGSNAVSAAATAAKNKLSNLFSNKAAATDPMQALGKKIEQSSKNLDKAIKTLTKLYESCIISQENAETAGILTQINDSVILILHKIEEQPAVFFSTLLWTAITAKGQDTEIKNEFIARATNIGVANKTLLSKLKVHNEELEMQMVIDAIGAELQTNPAQAVTLILTRLKTEQTKLLSINKTRKMSTTDLVHVFRHMYFLCRLIKQGRDYSLLAGNTELINALNELIEEHNTCKKMMEDDRKQLSSTPDENDFEEAVVEIDETHLIDIQVKYNHVLRDFTDNDFDEQGNLVLITVESLQKPMEMPEELKVTNNTSSESLNSSTTNAPISPSKDEWRNKYINKVLPNPLQQPSQIQTSPPVVLSDRVDHEDEFYSQDDNETHSEISKSSSFEDLGSLESNNTVNSTPTINEINIPAPQLEKIEITSLITAKPSLKTSHHKFDILGNIYIRLTLENEKYDVIINGLKGSLRGTLSDTEDLTKSKYLALLIMAHLCNDEPYTSAKDVVEAMNRRHARRVMYAGKNSPTWHIDKFERHLLDVYEARPVRHADTSAVNLNFMKETLERTQKQSIEFRDKIINEFNTIIGAAHRTSQKPLVMNCIPGFMLPRNSPEGPYLLSEPLKRARNHLHNLSAPTMEDCLAFTLVVQRETAPLQEHSLSAALKIWLQNTLNSIKAMLGYEIKPSHAQATRSLQLHSMKYTQAIEQELSVDSTKTVRQSLRQI